MVLYSLNNSYPTKLPDRLRLPNGITRTDSTTFTAEEIALAGYIPIEVPEYNPEIEQLNWLGDRFLVENLPLPDPTPDWDGFNLSMMSDIRFNQIYGRCLQLAPIVASALPTALAQVTTHGTTLFELVFNQICLLGNASDADRLNWKQLATNSNLPDHFVDILANHQ